MSLRNEGKTSEHLKCTFGSTRLRYTKAPCSRMSILFIDLYKLHIVCQYSIRITKASWASWPLYTSRTSPESIQNVMILGEDDLYRVFHERIRCFVGDSATTYLRIRNTEVDPIMKCTAISSRLMRAFREGPKTALRLGTRYEWIR